MAESLDMCLNGQPFSQVVSTFHLDVKGRGFDPHYRNVGE